MRAVKCQPVLLASEGLAEAEHLLLDWQLVFAARRRPISCHTDLS